MKIYYQFLLSLIVVFGISFNSISAPDCGYLPDCPGYPTDNPGVNCCNIQDVPLDGGVSLLIAGGIGIAGLKMRNRKKRAANA